MYQLGNFAIDFENVLGRGSTGVVYRGRFFVYLGYRNEDKKQVAIKAVNLLEINDEATKSLIENEKQALKILNNQFVIKLIDII
jgi:serine/threonine protein kinase